MEKRDWISRTKKALGNVEPIIGTKSEKSPPKSRAIYRIPPDFDQGTFVYWPHKVSIRPFSYFDPVGEKYQCLRYFLGRSNKPVEACIEALYEVLQDLREAYDQLDPWLDERTDQFLKAMILDGCYVLEILRAAQTYSTNPRSEDVIPAFDPGEVEIYRHDILLLENQLPMTVLVKLRCVHTCLNEDEAYEALTKDILQFFCLPSEAGTQIRGEESRSLHILDMVRKAVLPNHGSQREDSKSACPMRTPPPHRFNIPSAADLQEAQIGITTNQNEWVMDVSFQRKTLRLPRIAVDDATKSRLLNMIAFERLHSGATNEVTSCILLMQNLVKGPADARLLRSRDIIITSLSDDEVVAFFHGMFKGIAHCPNQMVAPRHREVALRLRESYNKMSEEPRKDLFRTYLRSSWAIVPVLAAILVFALYVVQMTVYTFYGSVNRK